MLTRLSKKGISSQAINHTQIDANFDRHPTEHTQPLIVVLITSEESIWHFQKATESHDMSALTWLVIFVESNQRLDNFCRHPLVNPFHLGFNAKMLVKCHGDEILREWYSVIDNQTEIFDLAIWDADNGLGSISNLQSFSERRHDMKGKALKIVMVNISRLVELRRNRRILSSRQ